MVEDQRVDSPADGALTAPVDGLKQQATESKIETQLFSPEARERLEKDGFIIVSLTGKTIKSLREDGVEIESTWHVGNDQIEEIPSRMSEIAINPDRFFLAESGGKTMEEQLKMLEEYSKKLVKDTKLTDVEAVLGGVADYSELLVAYTNKAGQELPTGKFSQIRTGSKTDSQSGPCVYNTGEGYPGGKLYLRDWLLNYGDKPVRVAPLIVPKAA